MMYLSYVALDPNNCSMSSVSHVLVHFEAVQL